MKRILSYVPGFRSGVLWKKLIAAVYYIFSITVGFLINFNFSLAFIGTLFFTFYTVDLVTETMKKRSLKRPILGTLLAVFLLAISLPAVNKTIMGFPVHLEITETLIADEKLIITGKTNLPDGAYLNYGFLPVGSINGTIVESGQWTVQEERINLEQGKVTFWLEFSPLTYDFDQGRNPEIIYDMYGRGGFRIRNDDNVQVVKTAKGQNVLRKVVIEKDIDI